MVALKPCTACGHMVSPKASACPQCGHLLPNSLRRRFARIMLVTVLVMFAILAALIGAVIYNARG